MEKKPNGYPENRGRDQFPCNPPAREGFDGMMSHENGGRNGCGGDTSDGLLLAYVYGPSQKFRMMYSAAEALRHGTLFEELYKPKGVYGNE